MTPQLSQEQIAGILQGITIPPQPQVLVDLQLEQFSPNCSIERIARLISQDVGLSGSIIKLVNSPFYKLRNKITSIQQAISLLGADCVINLVNAHSIKGALSDEDIIALGHFWDSAMDVAIASAVIAKEIGFPNSDEAYTLGLFHNAGIPLLLSRFDNYLEVLKRAYSEKKRSVTDIENEHLLTNHAVVGYYIAKSWNLPKYLCEAIHEHHRIERCFSAENQDNRKKTLLVILKMAEYICSLPALLVNVRENYEWERICEAMFIYTGLSEYDFLNIKEQVTELGLGDSRYYSIHS